jgi:uncharacterized protein (DUF1800 family)
MAKIDARQGLLGTRLAAHLLRRTTYQITPTRIAEFAGKTADEAVELLFNVPNLTHPEGPVNWLDDSNTAWLTTGPYENGPDTFMGARRRAMWFWVMNEMILDTSIRHKLTMFWHGIFVTEQDNDWREFELIRLFQLFAVGNIRELAYRATLDSKMLRYLNNNTNDKGNPNENYAREFLELFTILKGETVDTGNYTHYTEYDIVQAARVLTGFNDSNFANKDPQTGLATGTVNYNQHDPGNKIFSEAFGHQTIYGAVNANDMYRELRDFVDMIFAQLETARAYVRRLYRYFVSDRINDEINQDIVEPLAQQLFSDNFEIENTLKILLTSVHFYDEDDHSKTDEIIGGKVKSPLELLLISINLFEANQLGVLNDHPDHYNQTANWFLNSHLKYLGFEVYPLSVEGYPGFFKAPSFSKFWFDQSTIAYRYRLNFAFLEGRSVKDNRVLPYQVDIVNYFKDNFTNHEYADDLVRQFLELTLPEIPEGERYEYYRQKLLGELSPINWMFEWRAYVETGNDESVKLALSDLFEAVVGSPEFQTF